MRVYLLQIALGPDFLCPGRLLLLPHNVVSYYMYVLSFYGLPLVAELPLLMLAGVALIRTGSAAAVKLCVPLLLLLPPPDDE